MTTMEYGLLEAVVEKDCGNITLRALGGSNYVFDSIAVQVSLWVAYSIVFGLCFFGNAIVLLVVGFRWRIRSSTRLCMGNLAFANLCVSIFCIYQNLSTFLAPTWTFGELLCKIYAFINGLSHTASILTLVAICVERYTSVLKPRFFRGFLTIQRLRLALGGVWIISGIICSPRLYYVTVFQVPLDFSFPMTTVVDSDEQFFQMICAPNRNLYDSQTSDMIHFFILFLIPLILMTVMYAQIGKLIWQTHQSCHSNSSKFSTELPSVPPAVPPPSPSAFDPVTTSVHSFGGENEDERVEQGPTHQVITASTTPVSQVARLPSRGGFVLKDERRGRVLLARQAVIRMLIAIVFTFAVCNFPYHLRKICQYYLPSYDYESYRTQLLLPLTFLLMYLNCAISPILYVVMSPSFRQSLREMWGELRVVRRGRGKRRGGNNEEDNEGGVDEDAVKFGHRDFEQISV